jgi:hypothetical protein
MTFFVPLKTAEEKAASSSPKTAEKQKVRSLMAAACVPSSALKL